MCSKSIGCGRQLLGGVLFLWWALCGLVLPAHAQQTATSEPGEIIAESTTRIMSIVEEAGSYFNEDPDRYYQAIGGELDQLVDFQGFARGVMGGAFRTADAAGKQALRDNLDEFALVVRKGLIETYSKGLLAFGGSETEVSGVDISAKRPDRASVEQRVSGADGKTYTLNYQMRQSKDGVWKLRNIVIENTVNLGRIYRNQFSDAYEAAGGDMAEVLGNWNQQPGRAD